MNARIRKPTLFGLSVLLLLLGAAGCKKEKDEEAQGGKVEATTTTSTDRRQPQPSSASCEWYGEITWTRRLHSYNAQNQWDDKQFRRHAFRSTPVEAQECGAEWEALYTLDYKDVDPLTDCTLTLTRTERGEGTGVGYISVGISSAPEVPFYLQGYGYPDGSFPVTRTGTASGCQNGSQTGPDTAPDLFGANVNAGCADRPLSVMPVAGPDVQSVAGTCTITHEDTNASGTVVLSTETTQFRFRHTVCDGAVDSDSDGVGDCIEYDQSTDPSNPDTDGDGTGDGKDPTPRLPRPDADNDGVPDAFEGSTDSDGDGTPDYEDPDADNDGVGDGDDNDSSNEGEGDHAGEEDQGEDGGGAPKCTLRDGADDDGRNGDEDRKWDASYQATISCSGVASGSFRQAMDEDAGKGREGYDWDDQSEISITGKSYANWRQTSGATPHTMCVIDTWTMTASAPQNPASAPFTWTGGESQTTQWEILPTVGPTSTLRAQTCATGQAAVSTSGGGYVVDAVTLAGDIDAITHTQNVYVYLDPTAWDTKSPDIRHTISEEIVFDD